MHTETRTDHPAKPTKRKRLAYAIATGFGLGHLPLIPGTWGSLLGVFLAWLAVHHTDWGLHILPLNYGPGGIAASSSRLAWVGFLTLDAMLILIFSLSGVWAAGSVARHLQKKDPQIVVVDEISGQLITYLALATPRTFSPNWKYLLLGFILFRVLDVWKPFPARQAESLPGGLGIMADDWLAGAYGALGLWLVRYLGF